MTQNRSEKKGTLIAKACFFTALVNSLFSAAHGQEAAPEQEDGYAGDPLRYGPFDVLPRLRGSVVFDDNIFIEETGKDSDVIWTLTPGVLIGTGDYRQREANLFSVEYLPSIILFTDNSHENALDHDFRMDTQVRGGKTTLGLQQGFLKLSGSDLDVGNRADRNIYTTLLTSRYEVSEKTSLSLNGQQMVTVYGDDDLRDFNEWKVEGWADYLIAPKLSLGGGVTVGWVDVEQAANQTFEQVMVRSSYEASEKTSFRGSVGLEWRQYEGGEDRGATPVFSLGGTYRPGENTILTLDLYRRVQPSAVFGDQIYTSSGVNLGARQKLNERFGLNLGTGVEYSDYDSTAPGPDPHRTDLYFVARLGVDYNYNNRLTLGLFYQFRHDDSKVDQGFQEFDFTSNQVGLTFIYKF